MTTSLATYLVNSGVCSLLVEGVKEPNVFPSSKASELVSRAAGWLLDASVAYIVKPETLRAIHETVEDYRIIVCMRDQVERTVSAFAYYKSSITHPSDALDLCFGDEEARARLANDRMAPWHLRRGPLGHYAYTAILTAVAGISEIEADALIDRFANQSFAQRLLYEIKVFKNKNKLPILSILLHSQYPYYVRQLLGIIDARRVMFVTPEPGLRIGRAISEWLRVRATDESLPQTNASRLPTAVVTKAREFCASILGDMFDAQTPEIEQLVMDSGCIPCTVFCGFALS